MVAQAAATGGRKSIIAAVHCGSDACIIGKFEALAKKGNIGRNFRPPFMNNVPDVADDRETLAFDHVTMGLTTFKQGENKENGGKEYQKKHGAFEVATHLPNISPAERTQLMTGRLGEDVRRIMQYAQEKKIGRVNAAVSPVDESKAIPAGRSSAEYIESPAV